MGPSCAAVMLEPTAPLAALRRTSERPLADAWALALASQGISSWLEPVADGWALHVPAIMLTRAKVALAAYDRENSSRRRQVGQRPETNLAASAVPASAAIAVGASLVVIHLWAAATDAAYLYALGTARAGSMLRGEPWRAVTALTLHADVGHVFANACFGALFLAALFLRSGVGFGLAMAVAAGTVATYSNAALRGPSYDGLGASTAVFAALGAAGGLAARDSSSDWRRAWVPLLAASAMAALFGTSERSDVMAHALGLGIGVITGMAFAAPVRGARHNRSAQWSIGLAAVTFVAMAWVAALSRGAM